MNEPLSLIGYFPKKVSQRPCWLPAQIRAIRNVSQCHSKGPENWIDHWTHNEFGFYSTRAAAIAIVPEPERSQYELHAYRMLPAVFENGARLQLELLNFAVQPSTPEFESLGFDAVSSSCSSFFGCSPLSCNGLAEQIETNEHCLLPTLSDAANAALSFSAEQPEPGRYFVIEVLWRPRNPFCSG